MTNFLIYNDDDTAEPGRVTQSNKVADTDAYPDVLNEHGLRFIALDLEGFLPPHNIQIVNREPVQRPTMPISVSSTTIKAGGAETAVFTGIPKNATVIVNLGSLELGRDVVRSGSIDLPIPVPCTYTVRIELWPWMPFQVDIEAR